MLTSRNELRKQLKKKRRTSKKPKGKILAKKILYFCTKYKLLKNKTNIAIYLSMNDMGEFNTCEIIKKLVKKKLKVFVPVIKNQKLIFVKYSPPFKKNKFKIKEPIGKNNNLKVYKLDVIFMPLVGFDVNLNRLGMGGGFYDKTLECLLDKTILKPKLYALAYDLQKTPKPIKTYAWDIKLNGVLTEVKFYH